MTCYQDPFHCQIDSGKLKPKSPIPMDQLTLVTLLLVWCRPSTQFQHHYLFQNEAQNIQNDSLNKCLWWQEENVCSLKEVLHDKQKHTRTRVNIYCRVSVLDKQYCSAHLTTIALASFSVIIIHYISAIGLRYMLPKEILLHHRVQVFSDTYKYQ